MNVKCANCEAVADVMDTANYAGQYYCGKCAHEKGWRTNRECRAAVCAITGKSMDLSIEEQLEEYDPAKKLEILRQAGLAE